ncbi:MAG: PEP-CTERM sorting domain-containing protein [Rhodocyclaceae bacterium]|nr:PEP-CTERM sorting domain-containing protein [Rhodocyclaceae bacterium]
MRSFIPFVLLSCLVPVPASAALTEYRIDPAQSWISIDTVAWTVDESAPPMVIDGTNFVLWKSVLTTEVFGLAGTFGLDRQESPYVPDLAHLWVSGAMLASDVPASVDFSLPTFLEASGSSLAYNNHPCFGFAFALPPDSQSSCIGGIQGESRSDSGVLEDGQLSLTGSREAGFQTPIFFSVYLPEGEVQDAALPETRSFNYALQASAVPEPATAALWLAGLAAVGVRKVRR